MSEGGGKLPRGGGCPGQRTLRGNSDSQGPQAGRKCWHCFWAALLHGLQDSKESLPKVTQTSWETTYLSQHRHLCLPLPEMSTIQSHSLSQPDQWLSLLYREGPGISPMTKAQMILSSGFLFVSSSLSSSLYSKLLRVQEKLTHSPLELLAWRGNSTITIGTIFFQIKSGLEALMKRRYWWDKRPCVLNWPYEWILWIWITHNEAV